MCRLREEDLQPHAFSDEELQRVGQLECSPSLPSSSSASPSQQQQAAEVAGRRDRDRDGDEEGDEGAPQKQETGPSRGADAGVGAGAGAGAHRRLDLRLVPVDHLACAMLYFTGSNVFNQGMRAHALQLGFTLNEYSLRRVGSTGLSTKYVLFIVQS